MGIERLYGSEGAEVLYTDPAGAYEAEIAPWVDEHDRRPRRLEEFTVHPPEQHLPAAEAILSWLVEWVADNGEVTEDGCDQWSSAALDPEVVAATEHLRTLIASKVPYRMADQLVATHEVTWDDAGAPLLDGEPLHRPG